MNTARMIAIAQQNISGERTLEAASKEERFASMVSRQSRFVFRIAYSVTRNVADAEDVTQETFLRLYRKDCWDAIEEERAFLARVAWRIAVDRLPRRRGESAVAEPVDRSSDPEQSAIEKDWHAMVQRLIDALPEDLRWPDASQYTFIDVGTNIDCFGLVERPSGVSLSITADISSVFHESTAQNVAPTVRQNRWSSEVVLPLKKPTVLFTADDPTSKRQMQLELTVTPIK